MSSTLSAVAAAPVGGALDGALAKTLLVIGRVLFSAIFILTARNHFNSGTIGYAASQGVPLANIAVPLSGVVAILGGLSVALGFYPRLGAVALVLFLVPVTVMLHRFWGIADPQVAQMQYVMFMKNTALLGAALVVLVLGSGPASLRN